MAEAVISRIFSSMDVDGSGSISKDEMNGCFKRFDADGNGEVSREEWQAGFIAHFNGTAEQANKIYDQLDKGGNQDISIDALYKLFLKIDVAGKGEVTKDEFQAFWIKMLA